MCLQLVFSFRVKIWFSFREANGFINIFSKHFLSYTKSNFDPIRTYMRPYVQCTLYIVHWTLYTVHCSLYIVHCTLYIVHCTLYTVHCTLYIVHCTLYTVHCTLYTVHCTLYTVHCTLYIVHCTFCFVRISTSWEKIFSKKTIVILTPFFTSFSSFSHPYSISSKFFLILFF